MLSYTYLASQAIEYVKVSMPAQGFTKMYPIKSKGEIKFGEHVLALYYNILYVLT